MRKDERMDRLARATHAAKKVLKSGDRIVVTGCPNTKRWVIFDHFEGDEIVTKSGTSGRSYAALNISKVNGQIVDFNT